MDDDPCPIPVGTTGIVQDVNPWPLHGQIQISVKWDIERSLALIWPKDQFEVL